MVKKPTLEIIKEALTTEYFEEVKESLLNLDSPEKKVLEILSKQYNELDSNPDAVQYEKDIFHAWHKYRVFELGNVASIIPKGVLTYTIVTELGRVAVIRKPGPDVLGAFVGKMMGVNSDINYNKVGGMILRECRVYVEDGIESNADELFGVKMACVKSIEIIQATFKKN